MLLTRDISKTWLHPTSPNYILATSMLFSTKPKISPIHAVIFGILHWECTLNFCHWGKLTPEKIMRGRKKSAMLDANATIPINASKALMSHDSSNRPIELSEDKA
jgi:hypothetical protein